MVSSQMLTGGFPLHSVEPIHMLRRYANLSGKQGDPSLFTKYLPKLDTEDSTQEHAPEFRSMSEREFKVFSKCWSYDPDERPKMSELMISVQELYRDGSN